METAKNLPHPAPPHPDSFFEVGRRVVLLKVHRCLWSEEYPENSLPAIEACFRAPVARAEIDISMLRDADFLVAHRGVDFGMGTTPDGLFAGVTRREAEAFRIPWHGAFSSHCPPLLSAVVEAIAAIPGPTLLELDMMDRDPLPWSRVEELAQMVQPVKERVIFNGYDWNLRRLLATDASLLMSLDPALYLDWVPEGLELWYGISLPRGAYGYLDQHPLARQRMTSVADYLADRFSGMLRLVPGLRDAHLRLEAFEHMLDDGVTHAARFFHDAGVALDVWTLDAGTPRWHERLTRVVGAGVDCITTNTPHAMAEAGRGGWG